jgi:hypothetical protein
MMMKLDKLYKTKHSTIKREKEEQKERTQVGTRSIKTQRGSQRGKGTNYVLKSSLVTRNIVEKKKERKLSHKKHSRERKGKET